MDQACRTAPGAVAVFHHHGLAVVVLLLLLLVGAVAGGLAASFVAFEAAVQRACDSVMVVHAWLRHDVVML